ncbi:LacI family transcriptional regulator [Enterococcus sp. PF1-24]|uniref:LacI family DNA-binding transcriptional regulator n=1 Tax=unclassified Enterococcus TaxID=2608891 RepID=UPI0024742D1D|nr:MULTISPECIES: LacI family DNA-binding transcriptional regulator [unclassified Enterococcus]MDH6363879.1 LacI family transcriptional regulator [Enterococcus sp. PFB1-1]MDH6400935.1 LacI family transcriptional regulator [Enterococcus sp. PF1-24]
MKLTIKEIADLAGVSITTVSQILNHKGSRFSQETRQKVLRIVEEQQYKPDFFASNLIKRHSKTIGMIVPDVTNLFFSKIIEGVESYLNPLGYMILLCNSKHSQAKELQYIDELIYRSVDGIILATPHVLPAEKSLTSGFFDKMPLMLIDRGINQRKIDRLIVQEYSGAYQAMETLLALGHREIGMLREMQGYYQLTERTDAYRQALLDAEIPFRKEYVTQGELTVAGGYRAAKELLATQSEITAIFCGNDEMALGCYQAIHEIGKKVPDDISVVGFDGVEISEFAVPTLTTIYQPSFDIGFYAAKFLVDRIDFPQTKGQNKLFATEFLLRGSVAPVKN